jgi:hypothetical protein
MCLNAFAANGAFDSKALMEVCDLAQSQRTLPILQATWMMQTYEYLQLVKQVSCPTVHGV